MESKLILLTLFVIVMLLMSQTHLKSKKKIIFFGDSITEMGMLPGGYIQIFNNMLKQHHFNNLVGVGAGISGNKIYDLYLRLQQDVIEQQPALVVIFIGVNDVWHKLSHGTGTDAGKFEQFYTAIIQQLKQHNIATVLCTILSIGEKWQGQNPQDEDIDLYNGIIRNLAVTHNLPLCDLRKAAIDYIQKNNTSNFDRGFLTKDGVHLNDVGNNIVATKIWEVLQTQPVMK